MGQRQIGPTNASIRRFDDHFLSCFFAAGASSAAFCADENRANVRFRSLASILINLLQIRLGSISGLAG